MNHHAHAFNNAADLLHYMETNHGLEMRAPVDVDFIATALGIQVRDDYALDREGVVGQISFENDLPVVTINPLQNSYTPRRRFTLAHEIGHYCLHSAVTKRAFSDSRKTMSRSESYWDIYESAANSFAAQLLMPKRIILDEGQAIIDSYRASLNTTVMPVSAFLEAMANRFVVSSKAMEYRLRRLGIVK